MTVSKELQEQWLAGQLAADIALVIGKLVELEVVTDLTATKTTPKTSLRTHISLITGQITTEINPDLFSQESAQQVLNFHTAQIVATNEVVRDHLHSLRELLQILGGAEVQATTPIVHQPIAIPPLEIPQHSTIQEVSESPSTLPLPNTEATPVDIAVANKTTKFGTNMTASDMVAAAAQAGSPQFDEADMLPNKFDQVLRSAGVKEEAGNTPFAQISIEPEIEKSAAVKEGTPILPGSDEEWDKWLLEEDDILSELSLASAEVAKEKIPNWDEQWFSQAPKAPNPLEEWEQFIPEYVDLDAPPHRGQANVERFRQNLVNDPQLMNELLAELDDIEKLNRNEFPKP